MLTDSRPFGFSISAVLSNNVSSGFWDEPVKILSNPVNLSKNNKNTNSSKTSNIVGSSSNASNKKAKKEEIKIKEIFTSSVLKESSGSEVKFINWCTSSLASMKIHDLDSKYSLLILTIFNQ